MGDIVSLVEKAQQQFDEREAEEIAKKFRRNQFTFDDFYKQIQQVKKMGNIKDLAAMIPGVGKALKDIDIDDNAFRSVEAIITSMTPYEREHPEVLNVGSRRQRIARGSGTTRLRVRRTAAGLSPQATLCRPCRECGLPCGRGGTRRCRRESRRCL